LGRPVDIYHVDHFSECSHYFICWSVFAALWVGITAGGLRLQSARPAQGDSSGNELRQFQGFLLGLSAIALWELRPCDTGALARLLQQVNGGCMLDWAVYRKGPLDLWVRRSLNALLRPYRFSSDSKVKLPSSPE